MFSSDSRRLLLDVSNFVLAGLIALPSLILDQAASPYQRGFFCDDETLRHPYKESTVSTEWLFGMSFCIPFIAIVVVELGIGAGLDARRKGASDRAGWKERFFLMFNLYTGYLLGAAMSQCATDTTKYSIGRLRPHFIDVCQPDWTKIQCEDERGHPLYVEDFDCLGNPGLFPEESERVNKEKDARLSFVSGHASFAFQAMVWTIVYLQARLVRGRSAGSSFLLPGFQFALFILAFFTSLSRVSDYKHNPGDVLLGGILGTATQLINVYFIQKMFNRRAFRPPPRESGAEAEVERLLSMHSGNGSGTGALSATAASSVKSRSNGAQEEP